MGKDDHLKRAVRQAEEGELAREKASRAQAKHQAEYAVDPIDDKILKFIYQFPDAPLSAIGRHVGMSSPGVYKRMKRPAFQVRLKDMRADVANLLGRAKIMAIRRLMQLTQSADESIALRACLGTLQGELSGEGLSKFAEAGGQIVYAVQFGEGGTLFNSTIKVPKGTDATKVIEAEIAEAKSDLPKNTMELLS